MSAILRSESTPKCLSIATLLLVAACGGSQDRAMTPAAGQPEPQEPMAQDPVEQEPAQQTRQPEIERDTQSDTDQTANNRGYLGVGEQMRTRCNLPETRSESPQFEYDEAVLQDRGKGILDSVAQCLKSGALQNETVTITGHADPRGPEAYNQGLGMRRAQSARDYLVNSGVPEARIRLETRGEQQAMGTDPQSYQLDRRVEVEVAPAQ